MTYKEVPDRVPGRISRHPGHVALSRLTWGGHRETWKPRYQREGAEGGPGGVGINFAGESCYLLMGADVWS